MSEKNSQKINKRHKRKKHYAVLPYFTTPLIYILISMIVVVPMSFVGMRMAVKSVHKAQTVLTMDYNDVEPALDFEASTVKDGKAELPKLYACQKIAEITCENAGVKADVLYGTNRVSLRNGVGLDADNSAFGQGKAVRIYGNRSTKFKSLDNLEIGDNIKVDAIWGQYKYKVVDVKNAKNASSDVDEETLYLITSRNSDAFSNFNDEKLVVVAKLVSGPSAEEVQYE